MSESARPFGHDPLCPYAEVGVAAILPCGYCQLIAAGVQREREHIAESLRRLGYDDPADWLDEGVLHELG